MIFRCTKTNTLISSVSALHIFLCVLHQTVSPFTFYEIIYPYQPPPPFFSLFCVLSKLLCAAMMDYNTWYPDAATDNVLYVLKWIHRVYVCVCVFVIIRQIIHVLLRVALFQLGLWNNEIYEGCKCIMQHNVWCI